MGRTKLLVLVAAVGAVLVPTSAQAADLPSSCLISNAPLPGGVSILHNFNGADGANPWGSLTLLNDGLIGRTRVGGKSNNGVVFHVNEQSEFEAVYSFTKGKNNGTGNQPHHASMFLVGQSAYGNTLFGGKKNNGVIFKVSERGYRVVSKFTGAPKGASNAHSVPLYFKRQLWGMTALGGKNNKGTIYRVGLNGKKFKVLHSFSKKTGSEPHGILAPASDSKRLLGLTRKGGKNKSGTIFSYEVKTGKHKVLHNFAGGSSDGSQPDHGYLIRIGKTMYGITTFGGPKNTGSLFKINQNGTGYKVLRFFGPKSSDGINPHASLLQVGEYLYGLAFGGGKYGQGTLFRIKSDGTDYTTVVDFDGTNSGGNPYDNVVASKDGKSLYGMTGVGGKSDPGCNKQYGTVFGVKIDEAIAARSRRLPLAN